MSRRPINLLILFLAGMVVFPYHIFNQPNANGQPPADARPLPKTPEKAEPVKTDPKPVKESKYGRGLLRLPKHVREKLHELNNIRHGPLKAAIPAVTLPAYDARAEKALCVPPVGDQDGCGDCYLWSGCKAASACMMTNKVVPQDGKFMISVQFGLDCRDLGDCNGGLEDEVARDIIKTGWPSFADYKGAGQRPARCQPTSGMTLYKPDNILYCGNQEGVAPTQAIKDHIYQVGYVSVAAAAGSDWDNVGTGTITGRSNGINHAIGLVGWDDNHDNGDGSRGAWIMQNNWGTEWADGGYAWIKYGADGIGSGAFSCWTSTQQTRAFPPAPVPPTPPTPPGPGPVPPPIPGGTLVISSPTTATAVVGQPFSYQIVAAGATSYAAIGLPQSFTFTPTGTISGTATAVGSATVLMIAVGPTGFGTANLTLTSTLVPVNPVSIVLTPDQVSLVLQQANGRELLSALEMRLAPKPQIASCSQKVTPTPDPLDDRLRKLEDRLDRVINFLGTKL